MYNNKTYTILLAQWGHIIHKHIDAQANWKIGIKYSKYLLTLDGHAFHWSCLPHWMAWMAMPSIGKQIPSWMNMPSTDKQQPCWMAMPPKFTTVARRPCLPIGALHGPYTYSYLYTFYGPMPHGLSRPY